MTGVDDMSTQDVFGYFKEYPPAHIEWIDDTSCESNTHTNTVSSGYELTACGRYYLSSRIYNYRL